VEILMGVEEEYDIEISDEVAEKLETVQDYMDYLGKVGAQ
jgi:acyl carrier protein